MDFSPASTIWRAWLPVRAPRALLHPHFLKTQRDTGSHDERGKDARSVLEFVKGVEHGGEEGVDVGGAEVAQLAVLGPTPGPLIGVVLGVGRGGGPGWGSGVAGPPGG